MRQEDFIDCLVHKTIVRPVKIKSEQHEFAFTGMIRCGECGFCITASTVKNRFGSRYMYYHCTKKHLDHRCRQPYVSLKNLENQILDFLEETTIPDSFHGWALDRLNRLTKDRQNDHTAQRLSMEKTRDDAARQIDNLTKLRLRELVTDEEYVRQRQQLERERLNLTQKLENTATSDSWLEPAKLLFSFSNRAVSCFRAGDLRTKRLVFGIVGLNPILLDGRLNVEARKPFRRWSGMVDSSNLWRGRDYVRTYEAEMRKLIKAIYRHF
jgi:site-specific DNA recombinase